MIKFNCEGCGVSLKAPESKSGATFPCPKCKTSVTVPSVVVTQSLTEQVATASKSLASKTAEIIKEAPKSLPKSDVIFGNATVFVCPNCNERAPFRDGVSAIPHCKSCGNVMTIAVTKPRKLRFLAMFANMILPGLEYLLRGKLGVFATYWVLLIFSVGLTIVTLGLTSPLLMLMWAMPAGDALFRDWDKWFGSFIDFCDEINKHGKKTAPADRAA